jgi:hypothetical protein
VAFQYFAGRLGDELEDLMTSAEAPAANALLDAEYRGYNVPLITGILGFRKFLKGFFARDGAASGYNVRARQNGLEGPWVKRGADGEGKRFGFYTVAPVDESARDHAYPNALLLDYSKGDNGRFSPTSLLRDYLVRVEHGSDGLLLGKAYLAFGPLRIPVGFFVLERI